VHKVLSAPGKLFLSGEYSVLWGGTARILATGPRLHVAATSRNDSSISILIPGQKLEGVATSLGGKWTGAVPQQFLFVARAIDCALRASSEVGGFDLAVEPSPTSNNLKFGFGSSACVCVLAVEAVRAMGAQTFDTLKVALLAHASAQQGKGSGGDVAACFAGSLTRYQKYDLSPLFEASKKEMLRPSLHLAPPVAVAKFDAPWLPMFFAFTGQSQSTTQSIAEIESRLSITAREQFVRQCDALGDVVEAAIRSTDFSILVEPINELQKRLNECSGKANDAIERMRSLAATCGCVGKQSGASGGDGALFFAPDVSARAAAMELISSRGFVTLPIGVERGLRSEAQAPVSLTQMLRLSNVEK
jgi:phosphomevalonate kinase